MMAPMNPKQRLWLLAIVLAALALNSCANQEGVAPGEGELKTPGSTSIHQAPKLAGDV